MKRKRKAIEEGAKDEKKRRKDMSGEKRKGLKRGRRGGERRNGEEERREKRRKGGAIEERERERERRGCGQRARAQSQSEQRAWTGCHAGRWLLIFSPSPTRQPLTPMKRGFSVPNDHMAEGGDEREKVCSGGVGWGRG